MFFNLLNRSSLYKDADIKSRTVKIFVISMILYILLHSYLYSSYVDNMDNVIKYRHILFYIIFLDIFLTSINIYFPKKQKKTKKNKKNSDDMQVYPITREEDSVGYNIPVYSVSRENNTNNYNIPVYSNDTQNTQELIPIYTTKK